MCDDYLQSRLCMEGCYEPGANSDYLCENCQEEKDMKLSQARYAAELRQQRILLQEHHDKLSAMTKGDVRWLKVWGGPTGTNDRAFFEGNSPALHEDRRIRLHGIMLAGVLGALEFEIRSIEDELTKLGVEIDE